MKWYGALYIGDEAGKKSKKIISKIKKHKRQRDIYVLTLAQNGKDLIDIYPSDVLLQKYYQEQDMYIVGIAKGHNEAISLIQNIIMDAYHNTDFAEDEVGRIEDGFKKMFY